MTSSTTRAFMAKKPFATASAFMAKTNQLLSTMASLRLLLVMFLTLTVTTNAWGADYELVSFSDIKTNDVIIIVGTKSSTAYAMKNTGTPPTPIKVTISNSKITSTATDITFTATNNGDNTITFVSTNSGTLYCTDANNGVKIGTQTGDNTKFSFDSDVKRLKNKGQTHWLGIYNTQDWRCYTSASAANISGTTTTFYRKVTAAPSFTVTATSNNNNYGTVSVSGTGTTITAIPKDGYRVKSGTSGYTVTSGKATVTNNEDNTFTVVPTTNCTITINFEAIPKYTVTWEVNGEVYETTQVTEGSKPTFPATPSSCDDTSTTFYGWTTATWDGKINDVSAKTIYTSANDMPAEAATYHAVFCEGGAGSVLINETFDDNSNTDSNTEINTTFLNFNGASSKAFKSQYGGIKFGNSSTAGYITSKSLDLSTAFTVTLDACKFSSDAGNIVVTVGSQTQTIYNNSLGEAGKFNTYTLEFDAATSSSTVKIATSQKRAYIDNVIIATGGSASNFITTCTKETSYSVTYEANGGTTTCEDNTKYEEGDDVMLCDEIPTKENYVFNGWSSTPSVTVTDGKFKMPKSDVTFTAQWSECTGPHITAFNKSGTTDGTYNLGAELGTLSVTAEPSNGGNLIYRWYQYDDATTKDQAKLAAGTNNEATYQIPNNEPCIARHYYCIVSEEGCNKTQESAISGALTLNAIQYTITWSVNGTTQSLSPSSVTDGNNLGTLPTPNLDGICEGKTFVGWTTEAYNNYFNETTPPLFIEATTQPEGNTTYYAVFATPEEGGTKTIIFADEWNNTQDLSEHSYFDNAITLSFAKNEGTTAPKYYTSSAAIRLYYDNTMTVTTTAPMQSITFTFVTEDANGNSISTNPDFGTLSKTPTNQSTESLTHTWNVNTTSVTFTIGKDQNSSESGHCKISQIDVVTGDGDAVTYSNYTTSCTTTYTVTYNGNGNTGGTVPTDNNKYEENAQVTVLGNTSNLVKEGYTFAGWNTQSDGNGTDYAAGATFEITKNTTLYAKWEANTYTVCFNANGGIGTMENQSFTYGAEQALSSNKFTRDSYIFAGWATTADGAVVYTDAQSVSNLTTTNGTTVTLYAQWSELYTVTFYNMGTIYTTKTQETVGGSIACPTITAPCDGYEFVGWSETAVTNGATSYTDVSCPITPTEDTELYAVYSQEADGGGTETVDDELTYTGIGLGLASSGTATYTDFSNVEVTSKAIYAGQINKFVNNDNPNDVIQLRAKNSNSGIVTTTSGGKAKKVTVVWHSNTTSDRTLNVYGKNSAYSAASDLYNNSNQGDLLGTIVYGTSTELTISGDYEYIGLRSFENAMYFTSITITWATGGSSTTYTTSPDCAEVYNITIDPNIEHGSVTASPMSAVAGTTISLTATPDDTYKFDSWQVTDENSNTIDVTTENTFIMPETDVTVSAIFTEKKRYTITWYANGSEYTTTDVIEDIQIAPPALPNMENYCGVFTGWTTESPVSGNFDETPTLYNEQSEFPLATEETPKTFYAVFADVEGVIPEMPTVIAYWSAKEITTSLLNADEGFGRMTSNIALSTKSSTGKSYYKDLGQNGTTKPVITLSNLNLTTASNICFSFWARGSAQGNLTVKTNLSDEAIATLKLTGKEALYVLENIPTTATSIVITYEVMTGTFFFGTVKFYEAPEIYSFEKLTAENTNGWTGSDWDGYYLITDADTKALDGNAIGEYSNQRVEEVDNKIECSITTAFHIIYNSEKNGYSVQGVGDGDYLQRGNNTIIVSSTAVYLPAISYNSLKGGDNYELQWNGDKCAFYASAQSAPQMYKIMSELSNYRTLCTYDIVLKNNYVDDDSKDGHATITATKTTFNTFTPPTQRPGYTIAGYYAEPECTKKVVEADQTLITNVNGYTQNGQWIGGNVELYTKWQPLIYNLQSGNFFDWGTCSGGTLTLNGSAIGVKYQLYKDDVKYGEEISGTGEALIWEITESGNYTVKSVDPEMLMNGEAVVQLQDPTIVGENTVEVGKTITLTHPGHRDATGSWVSSNPEIARVNDNIVTGVAAGIVTITFHGLGNCDANHQVTVVNPEYTMTWKIDKDTHATTTIISGNPILLPEPPADNALGCCADKFIGWTASAAQTISKEDVFTTLAEAQDKFPNITEDKTFYAVFATAAQGVGTSIADFSEMGYENGTAVTAPIFLGDGEGRGDATITLAKAPSSKNDAKYYDDGEAVRVYAGSTITISSTYDGATIKSVTFEFSASDTEGDNTISVTSGDGTYSEGTWTGDATAVTFTIGGSTGHRRIASITVTTGVAGSQYTNYVTQCELSGEAAIGEGTVAYANEGTAIAVNCGNLSPKNTAATLTFPGAKNLTCPVTLTASEGFVLSTNKQSDTYQSKITIKPIKSGDNTGKLKNVYVRAIAPAMFSGEKNGTITVSGGEIATPFTVDIAAEVSCNTYTITLIDHLGNTIGTPTSHYEGDIIELPTELEEDACSENYTFDGWSTAPVEYGSLIYNKVSFLYTMPAANVILYPVYQCNKTADYHRVTSDLGLGDVDGNNWAGDYLIAAEKNSVCHFANGAAENIGVAESEKVLSVNDNIVSATEGDQYFVKLIAVDYGYILQSKNEKYNYINENDNSGLSGTGNISTAMSHPLTVAFDGGTKTVSIANMMHKNNAALQYTDFSKCFRFYTPGNQTPIYLYKKSPLYTTSLICEEITADDAMVTSTAGQTVKVNVTATMSNTTVDRTRELTAESDNADFTATITPTATENEYNVAVSYTPSVEDITDGTETANITIKVNNIPVTTFQVTGRHLPENFAIVAKVGNNWYALPSQGLNSETTPVGYPVKVDNNDNPIAVTSLPTKAEWALRNVYKVNGPYDRFAANGENLVFVNAENKTLYANNGNANIQTYAEYTNYATTNPERYEWVPTTTDLTNYTLKNVGRNKDLSINVNATFGTHASNIASNNLRFLPINATYNPFDMLVVEWYPTKVLVQTEVNLTSVSVSATVGSEAVANPVVTKKGGKLYEISGLPLESNPTKILTISYDTYSCSKVIPIIISREEKTVENAPFSTLTKDIYNYSDLVVRDGATLTINGTKQAPDKFVNVTIYPTAKIVVPENKQLSVYSLTFFGGISEIYNGSTYDINKYGVPQLSLKGTLGKTVTTMDYIMRVDLEQMYQVGVPYDVNLNEITYWDGASIALGTALYVSAYDGAARARLDWDNTWQWEVNFVDKVLKAGIGYTISAEPQVAGDTYSILRMPMKNNINSGNTETQKAPINVTAHGMSDENLTDNHKGWNYLSNPYMTSISGAESGGVDNNNIVVGYLVETGKGPWEWVDDTYRYVTIPYDDGTNYEQQKFSKATLLPFKSFFLQIANSGDLSFALASRLNAPMRHLQQQENAPREVEFELLLSNDAQSDNTGLLISEEFTPAYEINADLEKMTGTMSVYTIYNGYQLAYNALSPLNAMEEIPLGYVVPTTGEYTFTLDERGDLDDIEHIYLLDHDSSITTDLMEDIYTFTATEKKNDHRFAISVILKAEEEEETPTHLETLEWESDHPYKFIYQDKMYILRNGVIYDAMGKQVQTINK